jgi:hypothetical protein
VTGDYPLNERWRVTLPDQFNRRVEDGSLVLWKPQLTFWIVAWNNDQAKSMDVRLASILETASPKREAEQIERASSLIRLTYELPEEDPARSPPTYKSISGYIIDQSGHLQVSAYYDSPTARSVAYQVIHSAQCTA